MLAASSLAAATWQAGDPAGALDRVSLLTAWLCFLLLITTLAIGPWQALKTGRPLLNNLLRRDLGIWAAITGLAHLCLATAEVMQPAYFSTYITGPPEAPMPGWAGWIGTASIVAGYLAGLIFILLLGLSNNLSLRRLGNARWKKLQRIATTALALAATHGIVFQVIEGRTGAWLVGLVAISLAIFGLRRRARRAVTARAS